MNLPNLRIRISVRKVFLFLAALSACLGNAKASDWELRDLPRVVDPDGDCKCQVKKGAAEISVPGSAHDLSAELGVMNAPRALCEVEGDFSVRVKTDGDLSPANSLIALRKPFHAASLVIMADDANYVRLDRAAIYLANPGVVSKYANFELRSDAKLDGPTPTEPTPLNSFGVEDFRMRYLRLDRIGDRIAAYVSEDGETWLYLGRKIVKFPAKVMAGVSVITSTQEPLSVNFSEFGVAKRTAPTKPPTVAPLTQEQQEKLLATRLHGGFGSTFRHWSQLFLISTRIEIPYGVAMMTSSPTVAAANLRSVFPEFYRPTLRELLDAIAAQPSSQWKYDPTSKFYQTEVDNGPAEKLAIFEFAESKRAKPFHLDIAKDWTTSDKSIGGSVTYASPDLSGAMTIYELGSYSPAEGENEQDLLKKVVQKTSLRWAKLAMAEADAKLLEQTKVGPYDGLHFATIVMRPDGSSINWQQWVFAADNRCFLAVIMFPGKTEAKNLPDVVAMLESFRAVKSDSNGTKK